MDNGKTSDMSTNGSQPSVARRPARSKDGCLTCRRRKVRCNETKPICGHCSRLNMDCRWKAPTALTLQESSRSGPAPRPGGISHRRSTSHGDMITPRMGGIAIAPSPVPGSLMQGSVVMPEESFDDVFNYASFMWDGAPIWPSPAWQSAGDASFAMPQNMMTPNFSASSSPPSARFPGQVAPAEIIFGQDFTTPPNVIRPGDHGGSVPFPPVIEEDGSRLGASAPPDSSQEEQLLLYFAQTVVPPIIAQVETQQKWTTVRQVLVGMSHSSPMLRYAILAFSDLLLARQGDRQSRKYTEATYFYYYDKAFTELSRADPAGQDELDPSTQRPAVLAALFFLSYTDLLSGRMVRTHAHIITAHAVYRNTLDRVSGGSSTGTSSAATATGFSSVEARVLGWIRLIDARAVLAGGEGLFLSDPDVAVIIQGVGKGSPGGTLDSPESPATAGFPGGPEANFHGHHQRDASLGGGDPLEEVLFDILYEPGIVFFQSVQSFMARIAHQDPWHRRRGTVEDETEVMAAASQIAHDLRSLYESRPRLMDYAASGGLARSGHVSPELGRTITRAFRTFLVNYHASRIHLHRVAYKALPLARETRESIDAIRGLARLMVADSAAHPRSARRTEASGDGDTIMATGDRSSSGAAEPAVHGVSKDPAAPNNNDASAPVETVPSADEGNVKAGDADADEDDGEGGDMLPVNMLWPLLMWGSEETDAGERRWILRQIRRMRRSANNALITAQVLEEVQRRQDEKGSRQDIREVMEHIFSSSFAFV